MKIIPPLPITDERLTASSIPEPDASVGEVAWVASTAYTTGIIRIRTTTHRRYLALTNHTSSTPPENDLINWADIGPTNRYALFDTERNTASTVTGTSITFALNPGGRTQALCLFGLKNIEMVTVTARDGAGGPIVYTRSMNLSTRTTTSWSTYFFGAFSNRESVVILDLPPILNIRIEVALTRGTSGMMSAETAAIGTPVDIGDAQYGAQSDILDFSRIERDQFGNATLIRRKNVPVLSAQIFADKAKVPAIRALRDTYAATPLVFLALNDGSDDYFDALALVGIYKRMTIAVEYPQHVLLNLECEGL